MTEHKEGKGAEAEPSEVRETRPPLLRRIIPPLPPGRVGDVLEQLRLSSSPGFDFFALVVLSTVICTTGLVTDSPAVIIGGMLVAPFMSPILGLSAASLVGRRRMFFAAAGALGQGIVLAVGLSALLGWLARLLPFDLLTTLPPEIMIRTRPSPLDLGVALAGGAAAAYALAQPNLSAALPGVAIATALLPPLCTVGLGISLGERQVTNGAFLLFLANFFSIAFAGIATFGAVGLNPGGFSGKRSALVIPATLVLLVTGPLIALTTSVVQQARSDQALNNAVETEVARLDGVRLVGIESTDLNDTLDVEVTIRSSERPTREAVVAFQDGLARQLQRRVALVLIHVPATRLNPLDPPDPDDPVPASAESPRPSPSVLPSPDPSPRQSLAGTALSGP